MKKVRHNLIEFYNKKEKPLVLDGAMGSLLQQSGYVNDKWLWQSIVNINAPEKVFSIHEEYIKAGAEIITTNTFRTNPYVVKKSNLSISCDEFVQRSVAITKNACDGKELIIAGSNAPAEDCYQKERTISKYDLEYNHKKHIELLSENGVDIIWNETHSHWDEIKIISHFCSHNNLPFVISIFFEDDFKILSGEPITDVLDFILEHNPTAIGFNCIKPESYRNLIHNLLIDFQYGFYLNCGEGKIRDEIIKCGLKSNDYVDVIKDFINSNTVFIGSCCGSTPEHTKKIKKFIDEFNRN